MKLKILIYSCIFVIFTASCNEPFIQTDQLTTDLATNTNLKLATVGNNYYVAKTGNDSNPGTSSAPFLTIQKAADIVNPGDIVIVKDGAYTSTGEAIVTLSRSGTSENPIVFKSENKWGATFDGRNNTTKNGFVLMNVSNISFENFEFKDLSFWAIHVCPGSNHIEIKGNHIHSIGRICTSTDYGLVGTYLDEVSDIIFEQNSIHDIGRFANGENGCTNINNNYKNHDHGLYINGSTNIIVKNNIFYNIKSGQGIHIYSWNDLTSSNINILNNTFATGNPFSAAGHIMLWGSLNNSLIANNIFYQQAGSGLQLYQGSYVYSNVSIKNNVTYLGDGTINSGTATGVTFSNNFNKTDPKMVNPSGFDFKLQSTSPIINAGINVGLAIDYLGNGIVGLPDIGAYEYAGTAPIVPVVPVATIYYNTTIASTAIKNDCGTGYTGSTATYTVPANKYSSTIGQTDADSKAIADLNANKQAYANASGTCTIIPVYYNTSISTIASKNDCGTGFTGSTVTYTVLAKKYSSIISQTDADSKAMADLNTNKQAYANTNGSCNIIPVTVYYNIQMSSSVTKNSCGSGYIGSKVTYTISAGKYSSTISQADANAKAISDLTINSQSYANMNGTCTLIKKWRR